MQRFKNTFQIRYNYYYKMRYFINRIMVFDRHTDPLLHLMNVIAQSNDKTSIILDKTTNGVNRVMLAGMSGKRM